MALQLRICHCSINGSIFSYHYVAPHGMCHVDNLLHCVLGDDLLRMIRRYGQGRGLPREHYIPIMRDVLEAVIYLHTEQYCLHEDIKGTAAFCMCALFPLSKGNSIMRPCTTTWQTDRHINALYMYCTFSIASF